MVLDVPGKLLHQSPAFRPDLSIIDLPIVDSTAADRAPADRHGSDQTAPDVDTPNAMPTDKPNDGAPDPFGDIKQALMLGVSDYLRKTGFEQAHIGLSGGIDSAVVATLATAALGPKRVVALIMPSHYSSTASRSDAEELAGRLGIRTICIPIADLYAAFEQALQPIFGNQPADTSEENIQARIRGVLLMAYSNKFGSLTLTTGNKSELATGYCTLYGDMAGGLAVIGDLFKSEVYGLARYINRRRALIPDAILEKAPSAELRPNQKDEDSLPPYSVLDPRAGTLSALRLRAGGNNPARLRCRTGAAGDRLG